MFVKCPECRAVSRPGYSLPQSLSITYFCPHCLKLVQVKPVHDEVKSTSSADSVAKAERKKILVADDDAMIRKIAGELLTNAGYDVLKAEDGEQALVLAHKEHPDLIVLDLMMPKMSGFDVVREIRQDPRIKKIPILIMSVIVFGIDTDAYIHELGIAEFIEKANMMSSLVSRVQDILSKRAHQAA